MLGAENRWMLLFIIILILIYCIVMQRARSSMGAKKSSRCVILGYVRYIFTVIGGKNKFLAARVKGVMGDDEGRTAL